MELSLVRKCALLFTLLCLREIHQSYGLRFSKKENHRPFVYRSNLYRNKFKDMFFECMNYPDEGFGNESDQGCLQRNSSLEGDFEDDEHPLMVCDHLGSLRDERNEVENQDTYDYYRIESFDNDEETLTAKNSKRKKKSFGKSKPNFNQFMKPERNGQTEKFLDDEKKRTHSKQSKKRKNLLYSLLSNKFKENNKAFYVDYDAASDAKKEAVAKYYMPVLVVADSCFFNYHKKDDYENYLLTVMNIASDYLLDSTLGVEVVLSVTNIVYLENKTCVFEDICNPQKVLATFCKWASKMETNETGTPYSHQVAILVTRCTFQKCSGRGDTVGGSYHGGACARGRACAVVKDTGFLLGVNIAHQIGHLLGAAHDDGLQEHCAATSPAQSLDGRRYRHVMAPRMRLNLNTWSLCSRRAIAHFLRSGRGACLTTKPAKSRFELQQILPGVLYDADEQCHIMSHGSRACLYETAEMCDKYLMCQKDEGQCFSVGIHPAQGTACGHNKWCFNERCVFAGERPSGVNGGWGKWTDWGDCSVSCGHGVQNSSRACDSPRPSYGGRHCIGDAVRYRICTEGSCELGYSLRGEQCSDFDGVEVMGEQHTWSPLLRPPRSDPCGLYCRNELGVTARLRERAVDGTPCRRGARDLCVDGRCVPVGCDWVLGSGKVEDRCGVCGGDGYCTLTHGHLTPAYNSSIDLILLKQIPIDSLRIKLSQTAPSKNFFVISDPMNEIIYVNGSTIPKNSSKEFQIEDMSGIYSRGQQGGDYVYMRGPSLRRLDVWVSAVKDSEGTVTYSYVKMKKHEQGDELQPLKVPKFLDIDQEPDDPAWEYLKFSKCSVRCEGGSSSAQPQCVLSNVGLVSDSYCKGQRPPTISKPCNTLECRKRWALGPSVRRKNGTYGHLVYCKRESRYYHRPDQILPASECAGLPPIQGDKEAALAYGLRINKGTTIAVLPVLNNDTNDSDHKRSSLTSDSIDSQKISASGRIYGNYEYKLETDEPLTKDLEINLSKHPSEENLEEIAKSHTNCKRVKRSIDNIGSYLRNKTHNFHRYDSQAFFSKPSSTEPVVIIDDQSKRFSKKQRVTDCTENCLHDPSQNLYDLNKIQEDKSMSIYLLEPKSSRCQKGTFFVIHLADDDNQLLDNFLTHSNIKIFLDQEGSNSNHATNSTTANSQGSTSSNQKMLSFTSDELDDDDLNSTVDLLSNETLNKKKNYNPKKLHNKIDMNTDTLWRKINTTALDQKIGYLSDKYLSKVKTKSHQDITKQFTPKMILVTSLYVNSSPRPTSNELELATNIDNEEYDMIEIMKEISNSQPSLSVKVGADKTTKNTPQDGMTLYNIVNIRTTKARDDSDREDKRTLVFKETRPRVKTKIKNCESGSRYRLKSFTEDIKLFNNYDKPSNKDKTGFWKLFGKDKTQKTTLYIIKKATIKTDFNAHDDEFEYVQTLGPRTMSKRNTDSAKYDYRIRRGLSRANSLPINDEYEVTKPYTLSTSYHQSRKVQKQMDYHDVGITSTRKQNSLQLVNSTKENNKILSESTKTATQLHEHITHPLVTTMANFEIVAPQPSLMPTWKTSPSKSKMVIYNMMNYYDDIAGNEHRKDIPNRQRQNKRDASFFGITDDNNEKNWSNYEDIKTYFKKKKHKDKKASKSKLNSYNNNLSVGWDTLANNMELNSQGDFAEGVNRDDRHESTEDVNRQWRIPFFKKHRLREQQILPYSYIYLQNNTKRIDEYLDRLQSKADQLMCAPVINKPANQTALHDVKNTSLEKSDPEHLRTPSPNNAENIDKDRPTTKVYVLATIENNYISIHPNYFLVPNQLIAVSSTQKTLKEYIHLPFLYRSSLDSESDTNMDLQPVRLVNSTSENLKRHHRLSPKIKKALFKTRVHHEPKTNRRSIDLTTLGQTIFTPKPRLRKRNTRVKHKPQTNQFFLDFTTIKQTVIKPKPWLRKPNTRVYDKSKTNSASIDSTTIDKTVSTSKPRLQKLKTNKSKTSQKSVDFRKNQPAVCTPQPGLPTDSNPVALSRFSQKLYAHAKDKINLKLDHHDENQWKIKKPIHTIEDVHI